MTRPGGRACVVLLLAAGSAGCEAPGFYVRFSQLFAVQPGTRDVYTWDYPPHYVAEGKLRTVITLWMTGEERVIDVDDAVAATVIGDDLFSARPDGGVVRREDDQGRTRTAVVSSEAVAALGNASGTLVALRPREGARMDVLRSTDRGSTFVVVAEDVGVDGAVEAGSERFFIAGQTSETLWVCAAGDTDLGPDTKQTVATFELTAAGFAPLPGTEPWALPRAEGPGGLYAFNLPGAVDGGFADLLPVGYSEDPSPRTAAEAAKLPRLAFDSMGVPVRSAEVVGAVNDELLLIIDGTSLVRTHEPFRHSSNEWEKFNQGLGCADRVTRARTPPGPEVTVRVRNTQGKPLALYALDAADTWHPLGAVPSKERLTVLPAAALERGGRVDEVLPTGVLKVSGQAWRTEPAAGPYLMSLHCELEGDGVDEALLARGLIARLQPPRDLHSRRPWEWSTTWPLDPLGGGAVASLSRRLGRTFLRVHASRLGDTRVTRAAPTLREHLASWRELPGADEAYAARFEALLRGQEAERRLLARDAAIGRERMAQHRAERAEAQRKIIAGALVNAAGAAVRVAREVNQVEADTARIAAQSASNRASSGDGSTYASGQTYSGLSAGTPYSGGGYWVPPPPVARKGKPSPKTKPVCRWGQARDCPNGFTVGPVEYDCGKPSARGQAEASYQKQLAQCSEGVRTSGDVGQCFRERSTCLKECEAQEACEEPPRPAAQEHLGPEPSKTEQGLWWVLQTEGVTSNNSLGWQPSRDTAENVAVSSARSAAERECRARYEPELKPRLQPTSPASPSSAPRRWRWAPRSGTARPW